MKNNNRAAVARLAKRSFFASRQRNIIAVCAIALTTLLFTALFTLGLGALDVFQQAGMRQAGTQGHAALKYITQEQFDDIRDHPLVREAGHGVLGADAVLNPELAKRHGEFWYRDEADMRLSFTTPTEGRAPQAADEIAADAVALEMLGVPLREGETVTLLLNVKGQTVERSFTLVGWWEPDPMFSVSQFLVGEGYLAAYAAELENEYHQSGWLAGTQFAELMFRNTLDLEAKLEQVVTESGYTLGYGDGRDVVGGNVNWAYLSSGGADAGMIVVAVLALLLIAATGYLIIYNIFQISVLRDIRFYGLLKTIGATGRQVKGILRRSALWLCVLGIPLGMLLGYFVGAALLPLVMESSSYAGTTATMAPSLWMFAASGLFALATVLVSVSKPGRMAAGVSPVEAVRYTDGGTSPRKKAKNSTGGGKLWRMAFSNLGRNKRRTALVVASLAGSLVLLNTVFTVANGLDLEKYVSRATDVDFMITHAAKKSFGYTGSDEALDESVVSDMQAMPGFVNGGGIYMSHQDLVTETPGDSTYTAALFGADDWVLQTMTLLEGDMDLERLAGGEGIVLGVLPGDDGIPGEAAYAVGDSVTLQMLAYDLREGAMVLREDTHTFTVMAHVALNVDTHTDGIGWDNFWYLPAGVYSNIASESALMLYRFDVADGSEALVEEQLAAYTTEIQPLLVYISRARAMAEFEGSVNLVRGVGGVLSAVIGVIGILNFVNAMLTSIISRRQEFAVLESIGMTRGQLRRMLCYEGLAYAVATILVSAAGGVLLNLLVGSVLAGGLWFFTYRFVILPLVLCWPVLLVLAVLVPVACYMGDGRKSVILRLREAEQ